MKFLLGSVAASLLVRRAFYPPEERQLIDYFSVGIIASIFCLIILGIFSLA